MLDTNYLKSRTHLISMTRSMGTAPAGQVGAAPQGSANECNGTHPRVHRRPLRQTVSFAAQSSGVSAIVRKEKSGFSGEVLEGGADPTARGAGAGRHAS
jgi:hypothetical protein